MTPLAKRQPTCCLVQRHSKECPLVNKRVLIITRKVDKYLGRQVGFAQLSYKTCIQISIRARSGRGCDAGLMKGVFKMPVCTLLTMQVFPVLGASVFRLPTVPVFKYLGVEFNGLR